MLKNKRSRYWAIAFAIALLTYSGFKTFDHWLNFETAVATTPRETPKVAVAEDEAKPTQETGEESQGPIHLSGTTQVTRVP